MTNTDLGKYLSFAERLAECAREVLAHEQAFAIRSNGDIEVKADRSLVTKFDRAIEKRLREEILREFPSHGIIGEEYGRHNDGASHLWILDPIDGTAPFIVGIPVWGSLIALAVDGVPLVGVIDQPAIDARFTGVAGEASRLNGQVIHCRQNDRLDRCLLTNSNQDYMSAQELPALNAMRKATANRVYGGACLNYGRLAEGRSDLAMDAGQQVYDFAPFRPIVEGAGGTISDWYGAPLTLESQGTILASGDARCHRQALEVIASALQ